MAKSKGAQAVRRTAWYDKTHPTFSDALALVRRVNVPPSETVTYLMERVAGGEVEEIDRGITAELQNFPGTNRRLIGVWNWLGLTFDEKHNIWAEWYVEGEEVPYTKVVHSVETLTY